MSTRRRSDGWPHRIWLPLTFLSIHASQAGAPYRTDDPELVEPHEHELNIAFELERSSDGDGGSLPTVEWLYGAVPDLQISIAVPLTYDKPASGQSSRGPGDIQIGMKYRLLNEGSHRPMMSIYPAIVLPTGNVARHLGNGRAQFFLPLWLQKNWGAWQTNIGAGYLINPASGAKSSWFSGWQVQRQIFLHWTAGAELYRQSADADGARGTTGFNLGSDFMFDPHNHLLISAGRAIDHLSSNRFSSYVGYQCSW